uniref:Uncharacterized protein n=1 Tax=Strigamia maritima TaxID=126957 RepID=T1J7E3_STRMM
FKVLLVEDEGCDKPSYSFECFLFPLDTRSVDNPNIMHYRVTKEETEQMVDVSIFPEVTKCWLSEMTQHKDFTPHRNCPICFPNHDAPSSPWHSEPSYCAHAKLTSHSCGPEPGVKCPCKPESSGNWPCCIL